MIKRLRLFRIQKLLKAKDIIWTSKHRIKNSTFRPTRRIRQAWGTGRNMVKDQWKRRSQKYRNCARCRYKSNSNYKICRTHSWTNLLSSRIKTRWRSKGRLWTALSRWTQRRTSNCSRTNRQSNLLLFKILTKFNNNHSSNRTSKLRSRCHRQWAASILTCRRPRTLTRTTMANWSSTSTSASRACKHKLRNCKAKCTCKTNSNYCHIKWKVSLQPTRIEATQRVLRRAGSTKIASRRSTRSTTTLNNCMDCMVWGRTSVATIFRTGIYRKQSSSTAGRHSTCRSWKRRGTRVAATCSLPRVAALTRRTRRRMATRDPSLHTWGETSARLTTLRHLSNPSTSNMQHRKQR